MLTAAIASGLSACPAFGQFDCDPTSQTVQLMDVADFNLDGHPDAAIGLSGKLAIFFNRGDGTFDPAVQYSSVGGKFVMATDVNGDYAPDLVVAALQRVELHVYLNDGNGSFDHSDSINLGKEIYANEVGDIDENRDIDSASQQNDAWKRVFCGLSLINDGEGNFDCGLDLFELPEQMANGRLPIADLDLDGNLDMVATLRDQSSGYRRHVYALINQRDLRFREAFHYAAPTNWGTGSSRLEDINGDGMRDLLLSIDAPQPGMMVMRSHLTTNLPMLEQDALVRGEIVEFRVRDLPPGRRVYLLHSLEPPGKTVELDEIGGKSLDVVEPFTVFAMAVADLQGVAEVHVVIPANAPHAVVTTQAVVRAGQDGSASYKSKIITAPMMQL